MVLILISSPFLNLSLNFFLLGLTSHPMGGHVVTTCTPCQYLIEKWMALQPKCIDCKNPESFANQIIEIKCQVAIVQTPPKISE